MKKHILFIKKLNEKKSIPTLIYVYLFLRSFLPSVIH